MQFLDLSFGVSYFVLTSFSIVLTVSLASLRKISMRLLSLHAYG